MLRVPSDIPIDRYVSFLFNSLLHYESAIFSLTELRSWRSLSHWWRGVLKQLVIFQSDNISLAFRAATVAHFSFKLLSDSFSQISRSILIQIFINKERNRSGFYFLLSSWLRVPFLNLPLTVYYSIVLRVSTTFSLKDALLITLSLLSSHFLIQS